MSRVYCPGREASDKRGAEAPLGGSYGDSDPRNCANRRPTHSRCLDLPVDRIRKTAIFCLAGDQWSRRFVPGLWGRRRWVDADHGDTHHDWTTVALGLQAWNKDRGKAYARPTLRYRPSHKISFHARYGQVVARPPIDATQRLIASGTTEASTGCLRLAARRWRASD